MFIIFIVSLSVVNHKLINFGKEVKFFIIFLKVIGL